MPEAEAADALHQHACRSRWVFLVDADPGVTRLLRRELPSQGFCVEPGGSSDAMRHRSIASRPDAIVIGSDLSDMPAIDLVRALRRADAPPVLVLLARTSDEAIAEALDAGADDCMSKPFLIGEMGARLRRLVRRALVRRGVPAAVKAGSLEIDCVRWHVRLGGSDVRLSASECAMLRMLIEKAGAVVETADARRSLQAVLSFPGERTPGDQAVRRLVGRLRRKLELAPNGVLRIETLPQLGYRLCLPAQDRQGRSQGSGADGHA